MFRSRNDRRRLAAPSRKPVRLNLESLEERLTPSGPQTAGSYTDLVNAIAADTAANTNYVIQITNSFTFNAGGQVSISKLGVFSTLTIEGQNGSNYILTGNGNRLFNINGVARSVTFADLTMTGGSVTSSSGTAQGGAIKEFGGDLTLSAMAIQKNNATANAGVNGYAEGGGIYVAGGGNLTIEGGSVIQSNHADASGIAEGGAVYVSGTSTVTIADSTLRSNIAKGENGADATAPGQNGGRGGAADGGASFVQGNGWVVTLTGDTFSGNSAVGGNGGNGAAGSNATTPNASGGNGGNGGDASGAAGGAADFGEVDGSNGSSTLNILNDLSSPTLYPSTMIDNSAQGGAGGNGGAGGTSTGTAGNANGGNAGSPASAGGGAISIGSTQGSTVNVTIGNSTFYGNIASATNGATGGAAGTGGSGTSGKPGTNSNGSEATGGGLSIDTANFVMVNSTVANNTANAGLWGGGMAIPGTSTLENDTITQNTIIGAYDFGGSGIFAEVSNPSLFTLVNNLIQGNRGIGSSAADLDLNFGNSITLSNAANNFIGILGTNVVMNATNIGNRQVQLGNLVGVDANGNPTVGPIYYPLLSGVVSVSAGNDSVLSTIARVEGTTAASATDEIGNPRTNNGSISLGAVEIPPAPLPPSPAPSPPSPPSPPAPPALNVPPLLALFDILLGGTETVNGDGTETIIDSIFGIPLIVSTFDSNGNLMSVDLFGIDITFLFG